MVRHDSGRSDQIDVLDRHFVSSDRIVLLYHHIGSSHWIVILYHHIGSSHWIVYYIIISDRLIGSYIISLHRIVGSDRLFVRSSGLIIVRPDNNADIILFSAIF